MENVRKPMRGGGRVSPRGPMEGGGPQTHGMEYESDGKRIFHLISERVKKRGEWGGVRGRVTAVYNGGLRQRDGLGGAPSHSVERWKQRRGNGRRCASCAGEKAGTHPQWTDQDKEGTATPRTADHAAQAQLANAGRGR